jgi:hypothetical protein
MSLVIAFVAVGVAVSLDFGLGLGALFTICFFWGVGAFG